MNLCCATCIHKGDRVDGSQGEFTCLENYWPIKSIPDLRKDPNMSLVQRILSLFKSHEPSQEAVTVFEHLTVKENCSCTRWEGRS